MFHALTHMIAAAALALTAHTAPAYHLSAHVVHTPAHGYATETVTTRPHLLDCRGHISRVTIDAVTADGGEEVEPARYIGHGQFRAQLRFKRGDAGVWIIDTVTASCGSGIVQYDGQHPTFVVK